MRLTDIGIRALPLPDKGQKTHYDATLKGFGVRVSQGGTKSFVLQHGADRQLTTIGKVGIITLAQARDEAKRLLAEETLGKRRPESIAFEEALELFLAEYRRRIENGENKPRTLDDYERHLNRHFNFGRKKLTDITAAEINRRVDKLVETPSEQAHAARTIKVFFNWAIPRYLDTSPCNGVDVAKQKGRDRVLTDAELVSVWRAAEKHGYAHQFGSPPP
jgi:hypothetical protein